MIHVFKPNPMQLKLLVLADPDAMSASFITEKYVRLLPQFDAIIVCGPFVHSDCNSLEEEAAAQGDMAAIIAQLENIVCRVIYLPSESDPKSTFLEQLYLTPNSINIHARKMPLIRGLHITGLTEKSNDLITSKIPDSDDRTEQSDDELDGVQVQTSHSTPDIIDEVLFKVQKINYFDSSTVEKYSLSSSVNEDTSDKCKYNEETTDPNSCNIFVFNYKYAHSLSHFLFHSTTEIEASRVKLCIIPCVNSHNSDALRLPNKFGDLHIAVVKSLRQTGEYLEINFENHEESGVWSIRDIVPNKI